MLPWLWQPLLLPVPSAGRDRVMRLASLENQAPIVAAIAIVGSTVEKAGQVLNTPRRGYPTAFPAWVFTLVQ